MNRAYFVLEHVRSLDDDARIIEGIATTAETDHVGDVVVPSGARFKLPIVLLLQHDQSKPIGHVTRAKVTPRGIEIQARLVRVDEPGTLKTRLDEAWGAIRSGLVRGLSIGFSPIRSEPLKSGGRRFLEWAWHELSAVVIPANANATITAFKGNKKALHAGSVFLNEPAGSGRHRDPHPGAVFLRKPRRKARPDARHVGSVFFDPGLDPDDHSPGAHAQRR